MYQATCDRAVKSEAIKQKPQIKQEAEENELPDTPHIFPTLSRQPPLQYTSPRVKQERAGRSRQKYLLLLASKQMMKIWMMEEADRSGNEILHHHPHLSSRCPYSLRTKPSREPKHFREHIELLSAVHHVSLRQSMCGRTNRISGLELNCPGGFLQPEYNSSSYTKTRSPYTKNPMHTNTLHEEADAHKGKELHIARLWRASRFAR